MRDLLTLNVSLDPFGGFFAFDKTSSIRDRLPPTFETACQQRMNAQGQWLDGQFPENVSFGANGAYVMVTRGGGGAWNFNGQLQDLQNFLQQSKSLAGVVCVDTLALILVKQLTVDDVVPHPLTLQRKCPRYLLCQWPHMGQCSHILPPTIPDV